LAVNVTRPFDGPPAARLRGPASHEVPDARPAALGRDLIAAARRAHDGARRDALFEGLERLDAPLGRAVAVVEDDERSAILARARAQVREVGGGERAVV
jgi:hypothetical protein